MTLLLDTHAFLWWLSDPGQLATPAADAIADPQNRVLISHVSLWEIAIKRTIGKLTAPVKLADEVSQFGFEALEHIQATESLPLLHRDPFDRMLIGQAVTEQATLVSRDMNFRGYPVSLIEA